VGGKVPKKGPATTENKSNTESRNKRLYRPKTVAFREIRRYQKSIKLLIPARPFERVVREVMQEANPDAPDDRMQSSATGRTKRCTTCFSPS
jgi:histone H3